MNCRFSKPYANIRLICFPGAGQGPSLYTQWGREISDNIEVHAVCLPGREGRSDEPFCTTREETVKRIVENLKSDFFDKPFAFFGFSMGTILCFWVALELKRQCNREPVHMFLSSAPPPHTQGFRNAVDLSTPLDEFMQKSASSLIERLPKDIRENKDMMSLFLPLWKADFTLLRNLSYDKEPEGNPPLSCSLDIFCGHDESLDVVNYVDDWNEVTKGSVYKHFMSGDHYFLNDKANTKKVQFHIETKIEDFD